ncbi:MAG: methyl-accepting chemotaxis protein [Sulfurimonas sp.]|jgi:methyl-accepting chemotaxis protein
MKNLGIRAKLAMFPVILFIILGAIFGTYKIKTSDVAELIHIGAKLNQELQSYLNTRVLVYQQLRGADKTKDINEALEKHKKDFAELEEMLKLAENKARINECSKFLGEYDSLWKEYLQMVEEEKKGSGNITDEKISNQIAKWAAVGMKIQKNLEDTAKSAAELREGRMSSVANMIAISFIVAFLVFLVFSLIVMKQVTSSLFSIQEGLESFFSFLNRETQKAEPINLDTKDEFGQMSVVINENIKKIEAQTIADDKFIQNVKEVMHRVENGWFSQHIEASTDNIGLLELKTIVNQALTNLRSNFVLMNNTLESYCNYDYTKELKIDNIESDGVFDTLLKDINKLRDAITQMLGNSLQNGLELQGEAGNLKQAVETLSTASNQQAASLEETAAAMEEMTSNVQNNVQKSNEMATMATQTDYAAKDGAELAKRTSTAMTEIQTATNSINDAVAIIENIAFQTNILSLNAAVEAATAGDAGKGFAVVAQEVRNLANRSADAAKEIKAMAALAANKSNEGMNIATELTRGFEVIADKIAQTAIMVQDVSNANREQMQGIGQINTAVTQLDQMTQENAKVAAQADSIANATIQKAEAMVQDALSKEFVGKDKINTSSQNRHIQTAKPTVVTQHANANVKVITGAKKHNGEVWENF